MNFDHYSVIIRDPQTLVVFGHFIDQEPGFVTQALFATNLVKLARPISVIDDLVKEEFPNATPCNLSGFYAEIDSETQRDYWMAEGKDPDQEEAAMAGKIAKEIEEERLMIIDFWIPITDRLPELQELLLVTTAASPNSIAASYWEGGFFRDDGTNITESVEYWMPRPLAPSPRESQEPADEP